MQSILVISHVLPYPSSAGQRQRVGLTLRALRKDFHVTFATVADAADVAETERSLGPWCDEAIVLPKRYPSHFLGKVVHRMASLMYCAKTGLRQSNYFLSKVEFTPERLREMTRDRRFDCVLLEYWHAADSMPYFTSRGIPVVLDSHNILWQAYRADLDRMRYLPEWWKRRVVTKYRIAEEAAWGQFNGVVAINREEYRHIRNAMPSGEVFYAPMGVDVTGTWRYEWNPSGLDGNPGPPRICYYGSFSSGHNVGSALQCVRQIMPAVWERFPDVQFWIVGSNPPTRLKELERDPRVVVTGFLPDVKPVLGGMLLVLCPWTGTYGFRSRLIEVMALGVPVVANPDAVDGMDMRHEQGILLAGDDAGLAAGTLRFLSEDGFAAGQSRRARAVVEAKFGFENTYGALSRDLRQWTHTKTGSVCNYS